MDCITHKKCCKWRRGRNRAFETIKKGIEKSHWKSRRQQRKNYNIEKKKENEKTTKTDVEGKKCTKRENITQQRWYEWRKRNIRSQKNFEQ